jgi:hypothetical protein
MYNSINHFIEFGVKNIEKRVKDFVSNGGDLADLILNLKEDVFELIRNILQEVVKSKLVCKLPRHFKCSNQPMVASVYAAKAVDNELHGMLG